MSIQYRGVPLVVCVLAASMLAGCVAQSRRAQLERVAKDWCETIRASQVLPVYPLTQDLHPGDVFLVQTTQADQARIWKDKGFLPLDDFRTRLAVKSFKDIYFDGYWKDSVFSAASHDHVLLSDAGALDDDDMSRAALRRMTEAPAPRAAFPTYSFEVNTSTGLSAALPIQGIPFAMSFMNSGHATGVATIADARTYAAEPMAVLGQLEAWAREPEVADMLSDTYGQLGRPFYLRVVTRVYLTGAVAVTLLNSEVSGASAKAGAAPDVEMVNTSDNPAADRDAMLGALNRRANQPLIKDEAGNVLPGAQLRFVAASTRTVGLEEAFDRLLVIGYLGLDVPVYEGGVLGAPIPTFQSVSGQVRVEPGYAGVLTAGEKQYKVAEGAFEALHAQDPEATLRVLAAFGEELGSRDFDGLREKVKGAQAAQGDARTAAIAEAAEEFKTASIRHLRFRGGTSPRFGPYIAAFAHAYDKRN